MCAQSGDPLIPVQESPVHAEAGDVAALALHGVEMCFGDRTVLRDASLRVRAGEVVGLAGGNGAGKSTLLRLAAGLLRPSRGELTVDGETPEAARRGGRIGWCSAAGPASFTRRLTLRANLVAAAGLAGMTAHAARERIATLAAELGFDDHLDVAADRCSTGIRQRAALGRALLHRPELLLLDEPLRGVDAASAAALARGLRQRLEGEAVLWVSHARDELALVADRCVHLEKGVIVPAAARVAA